ncbi:aminoacyl-histidine dipeptidase [Alloprevotella sp. OH1205_COT-284]|uniref:aminoacyl-histidine dipeptidase n=1 Tax=Alloprevotella sp. OH1205_COT-284 TaxID=2491043 RepID=UPI000F5FCC10|nr:aminoacyl-histidine dipeptidase [Alloprevotella sp. OH1205_COT-284]RRD78399.1 aminoacyl-histidine dipeptidase [Alloprevotella sp. OH1205_COT-284]
MSEILKLQPAAIWRNFHLLTQVPRPSGHLEKIQKFLLDWAAERNIEAFQDEAGNILMYKPATPGMEDRKTITLQGHIDMVPQKTPDSPHNFETDPIETWIDGDWVRARNTTLGADDGMAIATIMGIFEDDTIPHGPLEAFMTSDEETTMYGVNYMKDGLLKGEILLNLDNETHGELMVGSAGGINFTAELEYENAAPESGDVAVKVVIGGLRGGHSGLEINEGRGNANKLLARVVADAIANFEARLASWKGGNMRNAIPRDAEAVLTLPAENAAALKEVVAEEWLKDFQEEYGYIEPDLTLVCEDTAQPSTLVPEEIQDNLVNAILACHNGVLRFIPHLPTIVETSSNLSIIEIGEGKAFVKILVRSSSDSMRQYCVDTLEACFSMAGMKIETGGDYPAWQPSPKSEIVELMTEIYTELFNEAPIVQVIHAGLECSVILSHCPGMDVVSFGPTLKSPHTPNERCNIPSVEKYWQLVLATLERAPKK